MIIYKIRSNKTGLYSKGGSSPSFNKAGKIWKRRGDISSHFTNLGGHGRTIYRAEDVEVVEIEIKEECISTTSLNDWLAEAGARAAAREQVWINRRAMPDNFFV
jgi:hypothetical protein